MLCPPWRATRGTTKERAIVSSVAEVEMVAAIKGVRTCCRTGNVSVVLVLHSIHENMSCVDTQTPGPLLIMSISSRSSADVSERLTSLVWKRLLVCWWISQRGALSGKEIQ